MDPAPRKRPDPPGGLPLTGRDLPQRTAAGARRDPPIDAADRRSVRAAPNTDKDKESPGRAEALVTRMRLVSPRHCDTIPRHKSGKARNQMQRAGFGLMLRPETSRVSCCPTQAPSS
jgi:hypothetical protein